MKILFEIDPIDIIKKYHDTFNKKESVKKSTILMGRRCLGCKQVIPKGVKIVKIPIGKILLDIYSMEIHVHLSVVIHL